MPEIERTTSIAELIALTPGDPPTIRFQEETEYRGARRRVQQVVPVKDTALFARLQQTATPGDEIEVEVETVWCASGYETHLKSAAVKPAATARAS